MATASINQRTQTRLWTIAFLLFVIVSGVALANLGYAENPLDTIMAAIEIQQLDTSGVSLDLPAPTFETDATAGLEIVFPDQQIGKTSDWHITWSAFGDVLYDLWFLCAATAFILIIRHPVGWVVKHIQPARQKQK